MKDRTARELAIPFVLDRRNRHHDVAGLYLRDIHAQADGRHAFRCAACLEPVLAKAGFIRQPYFAHLPGGDATPGCPWRTDLARHAFHGRNPSGDDGKWHIAAQCEIMTILELMGCVPSRNAVVHTPTGLRKPDIAVTLDEQKVHFEVQASPTDAWCATRRTDRDFGHRTATIWMISANAFRSAIDNNTVPAWVETLAAVGGGQVWLWDAECYQRSLQLGQLSPLRSTMDDPTKLDTADLPAHLPRVVPFRAHLNHAGRFELRYPASAASIPNLPDNLRHFGGVLTREMRATAAQRGHTYRYEYGFVCLNTPCPTFTILEGACLMNLRRWFSRQRLGTIATFIERRPRSPEEQLRLNSPLSLAGTA